VAGLGNPRHDADSFLPIPSPCLPRQQLIEWIALGRELGMETDCRSSTSEITRAIRLRRKISAVQQPQPETFEVRVETSLELSTQIPEHCIAAANPASVLQPNSQSYAPPVSDAFLVGSSLCSLPSPAGLLRSSKDG